MHKKNITGMIIAFVILFLAVGYFFTMQKEEGKDPETAEQCYINARSSILFIEAYSMDGKLVSAGSGFVINQKGYAVTAAHVVKKAATVTASLEGGDSLQAECVYKNTDTDVAILKLPEGDYRYLEITDESPSSNATLRALGYTHAGSLVITEGICSSRYEEINGQNKMLITCELSDAMSGGPVINAYGQVVGIASGSVESMTGINSASLTQALWDAVKIFNENSLVEQTTDECYENAHSCVLLVEAYAEDGKNVTTGSGVIVTKTGYAVTAAHVVKKGATVAVSFEGSDLLQAECVYCNTDTDVAVLKLPEGEYKYLEIADNKPSPGATLRALGYTQEDTPVITEGICSSRYADISEHAKMLITCELSDGMSGGPIVNVYGQVVGVASGNVVTMPGINSASLTQSLWDAINLFIE